MKSIPAPEVAYRALRQAIIEQALLPGTKLPEDRLAAQFGISRTPVRAVLARLQAEGLVDMGGKRSAAVARPSLEDAREIFTVRRALEREAVRLLFERRDAALITELERMVAAEDAARVAGDPRLSGRLAGEFHSRLAELTGNRLLSRYLGELVSRSSLILALYGRPHQPECSIAEHRQIIDALRADDADRALTVMTAHLDAVERRGLQHDEAATPDGLDAVLTRYARLVDGEAARPAA